MPVKKVNDNRTEAEKEYSSLVDELASLDKKLKQQGESGTKSNELIGLLRKRLVERNMLQGYFGRDLMKRCNAVFNQQLRQEFPWEVYRSDIKFVQNIWSEDDALHRTSLRSMHLRKLYELVRTLEQEHMWKDLIRLHMLIAQINGTIVQEQTVQNNDLEEEYSGWSIEELDHYVETGEAPSRFVYKTDSSSIESNSGNEQTKGSTRLH